MFNIKTYNNISPFGLQKFSNDNYHVDADQSNPDALLLRSHVLAADEIASNVAAVARAGAGVNNIPIQTCSEQGIVVFNTPGANANAVKELVLAGLLLASRGIVDGINYVDTLTNIASGANFKKMLEAEKKRFKGCELAGKTLGVVGLGAIGSLVADMALKLEMNVLGYDPAISIEAAWRLSSQVKKMESIEQLFQHSDFISLHVPAIEATKGLVNHKLLSLAKADAKLLNFARDAIVDIDAIKNALEANTLGGYISDFPDESLLSNKKVIFMPHIGASTKEAEDNCAVMAANSLIDFLENGHITRSVNFPDAILERAAPFRLCFSNQNVPKVLGNVLSILASANINVADMLNRSRGDIAYNIIDLDRELSTGAIDEIASVEGVIKVRTL